MQTTLLGIGIALILALLAALLGPLFIDWSAYRAQFEAEATRLIGAPVRVAGPLDVRLLPSPSLTVENLEIGPPGEQALRARALSLEFALGPLLSGKLRADQMRVIGPQAALVFDRDGRIGGQGIGFAPETLSIERLNVEDGRISVADAAGEKRLVLDKLWYAGDVRSLAGSFRGEGAFVSNGDLVSYRVAASRQDNAIKLRLTLEPSASPMPVEIDGTLLADNTAPRFEGALTVTRPAGTVLADGRAVVNEPFRLTAKVNAKHPAVLFDQLEFQYGPEERALKLTGTAEWTFGGQPRLDGVLTARALDIDKLIATTEQPRRPPFAAVKAFSENFGSVLRPAIPVKIGLSVDTLTLGGAPLQTVRGDVTSNGEGWNFDGFEFRAPGLTQVRVSGRAQPAMGVLTFAGPVDVASADPRSLLAWLEGKSEGSTGAARPMRGRGEVSFGADRIAIERLRAEIDRRAIEGRLAYRFAHDRDPARLDATLKADDIDLDALLDVTKAAFGGVSLERPKEIALSLDVGQARLAGVDIRGTKAALSFDASALTIERLTVADLGGASFTANGHINLATPVPQGGVTVEIDARDLAGVGALVGRFAPDAVSAMQPVIARAGSAKLRASFDVGRSGQGPQHRQAHGRGHGRRRAGEFQGGCARGSIRPLPRGNFVDRRPRSHGCERIVQAAGARQDSRCEQPAGEAHIQRQRAAADRPPGREQVRDGQSRRARRRQCALPLCAGARRTARGDTREGRPRAIAIQSRAGRGAAAGAAGLARRAVRPLGEFRGSDRDCRRHRIARANEDWLPVAVAGRWQAGGDRARFGILAGRRDRHAGAARRKYLGGGTVHGNFADRCRRRDRTARRAAAGDASAGDTGHEGARAACRPPISRSRISARNWAVEN